MDFLNHRHQHLGARFVSQTRVALKTEPVSLTEPVTVNALTAATLLRLAGTLGSAKLSESHRLTLPSLGNAADRVATLRLRLVSDSLDHCNNIN